MAVSISKNAQVLKFFAQQCEGLGYVRLQKLAYLADLESRELLGRPVSDFEYIWYTHGPFDRCFYDALEELDRNELVHQEEKRLKNGRTFKHVQDTGRSVAFDFTPAELEILIYVARTYTRTKLEELLDDIVYETEPMKEVAGRGERLPMEIANNKKRGDIGFDLDEVIAAEQRIESGAFVDLDTFFHGLQAELDGVQNPVG